MFERVIAGSNVRRINEAKSRKLSSLFQKPYLDLSAIVQGWAPAQPLNDWTLWSGLRPDAL